MQRSIIRPPVTIAFSFIICIILLFTGCASLFDDTYDSPNVSTSTSDTSTTAANKDTFADFYTVINDPNELSSMGITLLAAGEEPRIISSSNIDSDDIDIRSNHFICIGATGFNGPDRDITNDIKQQCKKNGASLALYTKQYTDTQSVLDIDVKRYDYQVYYYAPFSTIFKLGIDYNDLNSQERQSYGRNTGVLVTVVYKNTSAFNANILENDIIYKINNTPINSSLDLANFLASANDGDKVSISAIRHGKEISIVLNLD